MKLSDIVWSNLVPTSPLSVKNTPFIKPNESPIPLSNSNSFLMFMPA